MRQEHKPGCGKSYDLTCFGDLKPGNQKLGQTQYITCPQCRKNQTFPLCIICYKPTLSRENIEAYQRREQLRLSGERQQVNEDLLNEIESRVVDGHLGGTGLRNNTEHCSSDYNKSEHTKLLTCTQCKHGGHSLHILEWLQYSTQCPKLDCNCICIYTETSPLGPY